MMMIICYLISGQFTTFKFALLPHIRFYARHSVRVWSLDIGMIYYCITGFTTGYVFLIRLDEIPQYAIIDQMLPDIRLAHNIKYTTVYPALQDIFSTRPVMLY